MHEILRKLVHRLPYIGKMKMQIELHCNVQYPPGHYYSPVVSVEEVKAQEDNIFDRTSNIITGINLREKEQAEFLEQLAPLYTTMPFSDSVANNGYRYYYKNLLFGHCDGIFLHLMIRHYKPKRIVEVGSGFSSAVMLDTNEHFFNNKIQLTFIEPYPDRLNSLLKPKDREVCNVIVDKLQNADTKIFESLEENDILFIDSTHVSKTGSDVNKIVFEILPLLKKGVIIHFHDVFYPFEYLKEWVLGWAGFGWNEVYVLRALLTNNDNYDILLFSEYLQIFKKEWLQVNMPLTLENIGGSLWLKKQ